MATAPFQEFPSLNASFEQERAQLLIDLGRLIGNAIQTVQKHLEGEELMADSHR
jgi:hypothetical protein